MSAVRIQRVWCRARSRGRALYRDASRAAYVYVLGPPPSRDGDLVLEGESMHATSSTYTSPGTPTCEAPSNHEWSRRDKFTACLYCMVTLRFRLGRVTEKPLENGADLHVNERQKIRHYRAWPTEERRRRIRRKKKWQIAIFLLRAVCT